jgi:hypothetical protein
MGPTERNNTMTALIVNILLGGFLILFAAMAILPLLLDRPGTNPRKSSAGEDRVLRIQHKAVIERRAGISERVLVPVEPIGDHPSHRPAA